MRRLAVVMITVVTMTSTATAQNVTLGFSAGASASDVRSPDITSSDFRVGPVFGAHFGIRFSEDWGLAFQGNWVQKGAKNAGGVDVKLGYFDMPVLANFFLPAGSVDLVFFSGGSFNLSLTCDIGATGQTLGACPATGTGSVEILEFAIPFGVGVGLPVGGSQLVFDLRYDLGLSSVLEGESVKNSVFKAMARWQFGLR